MGGGMSIAGQVPFLGVDPEGTGDVLVNANLFQGNQAGAGAGGGVSIARTVSGSNANTTDDVVLTNNMIVNNVAAYAGGGVALAAGRGQREPGQQHRCQQRQHGDQPAGVRIRVAGPSRRSRRSPASGFWAAATRRC